MLAVQRSGVEENPVPSSLFFYIIIEKVPSLPKEMHQEVPGEAPTCKPAEALHVL